MTHSVRVVQGLEAMRALVPAWDELASAALEPNPFYEPWMLLPAFESYGRGDEALVTVWAEGKLGLLMPVHSESVVKGLRLRMLTSWRNAHYLACTPLVRAGAFGRGCLRALLEWMGAGQDGADVLELRYFAAGGPFHAALIEALEAQGLSAAVTESYTRAVLRRDTDAESYIRSAISKSTRRTIEKKDAELRVRGKLEYRVMGPQEDAGRWVGDFLSLEASGWKGRAGSALACSEPNRRFAATVTAEAFRRGRLMMSGIDFNGEPIARLWCFLAGGASYGFKTAYDERFKAAMPGFLAEVHNIRSFHSRPDLQWMDSYTDAGNTVMDRLWKDRLAVQTVRIGTRPLGALAVAATPVLRWTKQQAQRTLKATSRLLQNEALKRVPVCLR